MPTLMDDACNEARDAKALTMQELRNAWATWTDINAPSTESLAAYTVLEHVLAGGDATSFGTIWQLLGELERQLLEARGALEKIRLEEERIENQCKIPPRGWVCSRGKAHEGPCAATQSWAVKS